MTFFFFVVGLEARREFDLGELRERRRLALPLRRRRRRRCSCRSRSTSRSTPASRRAHGWGAAMSTDTAFALGMLALVGPRFPDRLRAFLLTVVVVDDLVALVVIARRLHRARSSCARCCVAIAALRRRPCSLRAAPACSYGIVVPRCSAAAAWVALLRGGRRAGRRRPGDRAADVRVPGGARRPRAGDRALPRCSASSRRPELARSAARRPARRRSRRTSACSSSTTRGRAT